MKISKEEAGMYIAGAIFLIVFVYLTYKQNQDFLKDQKTSELSALIKAEGDAKTPAEHKAVEMQIQMLLSDYGYLFPKKVLDSLNAEQKPE